MKKTKYGCICLIAALLLSLLVGCGTADNGQNNSEAVDTELSTETVIETESETEEEPEPVVSTVTITATGDCTLARSYTHSYSGSFTEYYDAYGETYFFENFKDVFEQDDITLINLECVFSDSNDRVDKAFNFKGDLTYTGILTSSSVEACSLGNNHIIDYGTEGMEDTMAVLEDAGVTYGFNETIGYYITKDGLKVAIVSTSVLASSRAWEHYVTEGTQLAREQGADLVVVCCHWGIEGDHYPTEYQRELGHKLIDLGADLVVGNHPHVLQGIEEYNGKIIIYSLGNFSFGGNRNPSDKNTAVYQQTFTFVDGVLQADITAKIIPSRLSGHNGYNDYQPIIAQGEQAATIINKMNQYSANYSGVYFDEEGTLLIKE